MPQNSCASKEEVIYKAVEKLMTKDLDMQSIKMSDVAAVAGIGKGTIYEYFSSKEELFVKSIIYYIGNVLEVIKDIIRDELSFKEKFLTGFENIYENKQKGCILFRVISQMPIEIFKNNILEDGSGERLLEDIQNAILELYEYGVAQGVIKKHDKEYVFLTVRASVSAYITSVIDMENEEKRREVLENTYKLFVKALN